MTETYDPEMTDDKMLGIITDRLLPVLSEMSRKLPPGVKNAITFNLDNWRVTFDGSAMVKSFTGKFEAAE